MCKKIECDFSFGKKGKVMKRFKVLGTDGKCSIPWMIISPHEEQAIYNHRQDLETLNKRGGLCWSEMIAVLEDRRYIKMDESIARKKVEEIIKKQICTVQMIKNDGGHYVPMECCSMTNHRTSNGISEIDDIEIPCGLDCGKDCNNCIIQRIMDEYAEITKQVT